MGQILTQASAKGNNKVRKNINGIKSGRSFINLYTLSCRVFVEITRKKYRVGYTKVKVELLKRLFQDKTGISISSKFWRVPERK